jgi:hypothetical protein
MAVMRDTRGVIVNADNLNADDVANERVLCPACRNHVFVQWPLGWDAHSAHRCIGISGVTQEQRKAKFKARYRHLFR